MFGYDNATYLKPLVITQNIKKLDEYIKNEGSEMGMSYKIDDNNIGVWEIIITKLPDCHLKESLNNKPIHIMLELPHNYPFKPPFVYIKSPTLMHASLGESSIFNGSICVDVLYNNWSPVISIDRLMIILLNIICNGTSVKNFNENSREYALSGRSHIMTSHPDWK
jgi:ubiquitin-protein ligase